MAYEPKTIYHVQIETPAGEREFRKVGSRRAAVELKHEFPVGTVFELEMVGYDISLTLVKDEDGFLI